MRSHIISDEQPIVICIGSRGDVRTAEAIKDEVSPWSFDVCVKNGWNVISFIETDEDGWYRNPAFVVYLAELSEELTQVPKCIGYGESMGSYAVWAYSRQDRAVGK